MKCFTCRTEYNIGPCPTCERNRLLSVQNDLMSKSNRSSSFEGPAGTDDPVIIFWSWVIGLAILAPAFGFMYYICFLYR